MLLWKGSGGSSLRILGPPTLVALLLVASASAATAEILPWSDRPTFVNRVDYTLDISCSGTGLVCEALDAYTDTQLASVSGSGEVDLDLVAGTLQFLQDGTQDVGSGPQASYATLDVADLVFAEIPFVGAPATEGGVVFALANPIFDAGTPLSVGTHPISVLVSYAALADIVGPVDAYIPEIQQGPTDVLLSGELEVTALLPGGGIAYSLNDLTGTLQVSNPTTLLGEDVVVTVTADMTLNLSGNNFTPGFTPLPALGGWASAGLCGALAGLGAAMLRRRTAKTGGTR